MFTLSARSTRVCTTRTVRKLLALVLETGHSLLALAMRLPPPLISTRTCQLSQGLQMLAVFAQTVSIVMLEAAPSLATAEHPQAQQLCSRVWRATPPASGGLPAATEQMRKHSTSTSALACQLLAYQTRHAGQKGCSAFPDKHTEQSSAQLECCFHHKVASAEH